MVAVADARGLKRICAGCGARFYDMNKRPVVCPSCDTEFTGEIKVKTRRGRVPAAEEGQVSKKTEAEAANDGEIEDEDTGDVDVVSLDDAAADEVDGDDEDDIADADLDLDNLDDDDESDDDLSGLEGDVNLKVDSEKE